ncbi:universal stress protein [Halosegnis sp.]|uniref:universal stress protein n=1 Tax=Halosegnis sp. TaxID=2864959 RepID=UPI0035D4044A
MEFVVAYDGTPLSEAALKRAGELADAPAAVTAITIVPQQNGSWARKRDWLGPDESFDLERVRVAIERAVHKTLPEARLEMETVGKHAPPGTIGTELRKLAAEVDPDVVAVGSDNAGRVVDGLGSAASSVTTDDRYDMLIVRRPA